MKAEVVIRAAGRDSRGAGPAACSGLRPPTLIAVGALHIGLLAALCLLVHPKHVLTPPQEIAIPVIFAPPQDYADPSPQILEPSTVPVPSSVQTAFLAPIPSATLPASRLGELPRPALRSRPPDQSRTVQVADPAPSPPASRAATPPEQRVAAAAPATSSQKTQRVLDSWTARMRQAVQDAAVYPASARLLHHQGRAQVRFDYDQGAIARASILQSSHFDALDNAALAAVTRAVIPAPPIELGLQTRTLLVWVQFGLETED